MVYFFLHARLKVYLSCRLEKIALNLFKAIKQEIFPWGCMPPKTQTPLLKHVLEPTPDAETLLHRGSSWIPPCVHTLIYFLCHLLVYLFAHQRWKVTKYIYSRNVLKYNFEILPWVFPFFATFYFYSTTTQGVNHVLYIYSTKCFCSYFAGLH